MAAGEYLVQRGKTWYVQVRIPPSLEAFLGKRGTLRRALGTTSKAEAERLKHRVVGDMKALLADAARRMKAGGLPGALSDAGSIPEGALAVAHQIRQLRQQGRYGEAEAVEHVAEDIARAMESKDPEAATRWFHTATAGDTKSLDEHLEDWLRWLDVREQTKDAHRRSWKDLRAFLKAAPTDRLYLRDITQEAVVRFIVSYLPGLGYSHRSVTKRLQTMAGLWEHLGTQLVVPLGSNPWRGLKVNSKQLAREGPKARRSGEKRGYSDAELLTLLRGTERSRAWPTYSYIPDLLILGMYTGARLDELCSLKVADVDLQDNGGTQQAFVRITKGKTKAAARMLAVTHAGALAVLQKRTAGKDAAAYLFDELKQGGRDAKLSWSASKALTRYRRDAALPAELDFHGLRRTFLTKMEHAGIGVEAMRFVGHEVPTIMHTIYSDGASRQGMLKVADAIRYGAEVEQEVAALAS